MLIFAFLLLFVIFMVGVSIIILEMPKIKHIIIGVILMCLSLISIFKIATHKPLTELQLQHTVNIYALEDNFTAKGRIFYFDQDNRYYFLKDYKEGKKMDSISKNNAYIVEMDDTQPRIELYKEVNIGSGILNYLYRNTFLNTEYKIIVPKQTLTKDFNIDMKK